MVLKGSSSTQITPYPPYATPHDAIQGRRIWLSGGAGGLGREFSKALLDHGCAALMLIDIVADDVGRALAHQLQRQHSKHPSGARVEYERVDVCDAAGVEASLRRSARAFGGLDTVVNNAGVGDERELRKTIGVNLVAVMEATESAVRVFGEAIGGKEGRESVIVNVASAGGLFAIPVAPIYCGSKFGVVGYTKSMREACWERGIRIVCFCPGFVEVGLGKTVRKGGNVAKFTGIMKGDAVAGGLVEVLRRRDLVGEAVYMSERMGKRIVRTDVSRRLADATWAKL